uniref:Uncharacterized protein n=1 Tax=Anopheles atroparvus TaxID=41427 RepID=A0A182JB32_ANOAO
MGNVEVRRENAKEVEYLEEYEGCEVFDTEIEPEQRKETTKTRRQDVPALEELVALEKERHELKKRNIPKIGGAGSVVEIDGTKITKRKANTGRVSETHKDWLVGGASVAKQAKCSSNGQLYEAVLC